jgi:transcription initiation factor TFIIIB Brf1 subunit/transcription initiation factor TFIIB
MSHFNLFNETLKEYEKTKIITEEETKFIVSETEDNVTEIESDSTTTCPHTTTITEKGTSVCTECGEELEFNISHEKEWKYFGQDEKKIDKKQIQMKKEDDRGIYKDVENLGFSDNITTIANKIYMEVSKNKIFRGNFRKSVIFACIFHAFKLEGKSQSHDSLIQVFNLKKKSGLKGLKHVSLNAPKDSKIRTKYITPVDLIKEIMDKFSSSSLQIEQVVKLYDSIRNKSSKLNRARPQSIASAIVFYWTEMNNKNITIKDFAKKVGLSELTISRIVKEIREVLHTPEVN